MDIKPPLLCKQHDRPTHRNACVCTHTYALMNILAREIGFKIPLKGLKVWPSFLSRWKCFPQC